MASYQFLCFLSLIVITILTQFGLHADAQASSMYHFCEGSNYTDGSSYQSNLNLLLSSLSSSVVSVNNGFSNNTIGRNPNKVYGLFLCRGKMTTEDCETCVEKASEEIPQRCPNKKEAMLWYDDCMLRYSNQSIFSVMEERPVASLWNINNVSDPNQFRPILGKLMEGLVSKATISSSKFSTGEENFNSSQKIYGLAQCTPDLSASSCNKCLQGAVSQIPSCCDGKQGGRVLQPSCNVRYELYDFYGADQADAPAPATSLPPKTPSPLESPSPSLSLPPMMPSPLESPSPSLSLPPMMPSPLESPSPSLSLPPMTPSPLESPSPALSLPPMMPSPLESPSPSLSLPPMTPSPLESPSSLPTRTPSLPTSPPTPSLTPMTPSPSVNPTPTNGKGKTSSNILLTVVVTSVLSLMLTSNFITQFL